MQSKIRWQLCNEQHPAERTKTDIRLKTDLAQFHPHHIVLPVHLRFASNERRTAAADSRVVGCIQNTIWSTSVYLRAGQQLHVCVAELGTRPLRTAPTDIHHDDYWRHNDILFGQNLRLLCPIEFVVSARNLLRGRLLAGYFVIGEKICLG